MAVSEKWPKQNTLEKTRSDVLNFTYKIWQGYIFMQLAWAFRCFIFMQLAWASRSTLAVM